MNLWSTFLELDALSESEENKLWTFTGKAQFFNRKIGRQDCITIADPLTVGGVSEAKALNNAKYKIRKNNGLPTNTILTLFDYTLKPIQTQQPKHKEVVKTKPPVEAKQLSIDDLFI
jgi:hypothetical protein